MGFLLDIDYKSSGFTKSGHENLFLDEGWGGVRDVRGPYMVRPRAAIVIPVWAFSRAVNSRLYLQFGLSNRCPVDALIFNLSGRFGSSSHIIRRSSEADVNFEEIPPRDSFNDYRIDVRLHDPDPSNALKFMDILSIDRLMICRGKGLDI
jgi:hypothetical protein